MIEAMIDVIMRWIIGGYLKITDWWSGTPPIRQPHKWEAVLLAHDVNQNLARALTDPLPTRDGLIASIAARMKPYEQQVDFLAYKDNPEGPRIWLIAGVNGSGKTSTIGKLAKQLVNLGLKVRIVAADTFRAAAVEQVARWAKESGASLTTSTSSDPASAAYKGVQEAIQHHDDIVLVDTAGRLHNKEHLMAELSKVRRSMAKADPRGQAPHEILLVLDGTVGQNALAQVKYFAEALNPLSGLIVTKLDGHTKGGVLMGLTETFKLPLFFVSSGQHTDSLKPFSAQAYAENLMRDAE